MTSSIYTTYIDNGAPPSTMGIVGQWYVDTSETPAALYLCTNVTEGVSTWTNVSLGNGGSSNILIGAVDPTTSTEGSIGQLYLNVTTGTLFSCDAIQNGQYAWNLFGYTSNGITAMLNTQV